MLCQDVSLFNYSKNQNHFINYYHEFYASYSDDHVSSMWWGWCKLQTEPAQLKVELLCWGYRLSLATPGTPGTPASGSGSAASCDKPVQTEPRLLSGAGITRHISGSASNPWIYEVVRNFSTIIAYLHSLLLDTLKLKSNTQKIQHIRQINSDNRTEGRPMSCDMTMTMKLSHKNVHTEVSNYFFRQPRTPDPFAAIHWSWTELWLWISTWFCATGLFHDDTVCLSVYFIA